VTLFDINNQSNRYILLIKKSARILPKPEIKGNPSGWLALIF